MIEVRNQDKLVEEAVASLIHPNYPSSLNLAVPPGFGEDELGDQIAAKLREHKSNPVLAILSSDEVQGVDMYVRELHRQWSETVQIPGLAQGETAEAFLRRLLSSLVMERPTVLILKRFHKVLDSLESWVLGLLREYERRHHLRTVTISPYNYEELKKRWRRLGHILTASNYGDTHSLYSVELLSASEIVDICRSKDVPDHVNQYALDLTGGYPEPFSTLIELWIRMGKPQLKPEVKLKLRETAEQRFRRFVEWLDPPDQTRYRDLVIDLHQRFETEKAYHLLSYHPWKHVLLDDDGLRAECAGRAAVSAAVQEAIDKKAEYTITSNVVERARTMYERRQYSTVLQLLEGIEPSSPYIHLQVLRAHASVMSVLYKAEGDELGVDTDWSKLRQAVKRARKILEKSREIIPSYSQIESRYSDLEQVSESIIAATSSGKRRVVDVLSGLTGRDAHINRKVAVLLLLLKLEAGRTIAGNASACQLVLALPEQIFRVWALWRLDLNYYDAPTGHEEVWQEVERKWPHESLTKPKPGKQFPSFELFSYFAFTLLLRTSPKDVTTAPELDFPSLQKALSTLDVRRDSAHAVFLTNSKLRSKYFDLIDRWLDSIFSACPESVSREELLAIIEPLPIVDENGSMIWMSS